MEKDVYCSYRSRGCKKICTLRDLKDHMKTCVYGVVSCPLKCGVGVVIKMLPSHMSTECPRRTILCTHCGDDIALQSKKDHESNCHRRPTLCNFCKRKMAFCELKKHYETCLGKPRNCKLALMGCKFVGNKDEVEQHESIWKIHVDLLTKYLHKNNNYSDDLKLRISDILKIVKELSEENTVLKQNLGTLSSQFQTIIEDNSVLKDKINKMESNFGQTIDSMTEEQKYLASEVQRLRDLVAVGESSV
uniref:TRAF-type domain-containing protein n=2 Tax=Tetranychus urticae TaxID=32264 RepID=T1KZB8_TETUR